MPRVWLGCWRRNGPAGCSLPCGRAMSCVGAQDIGPLAGWMPHEADGLTVKDAGQCAGPYQHLSGCTFDLVHPSGDFVPPAGFEPARAAPEAVFPYGSDLPKRARRDLARAHIGRSPPTLHSAGVRPAFRLTLHDRHPGFGEARSAAVDMGGDLVAEVAILLRTEPGELPADPTAGRRPHLADERMGSAQQSGQRRMQTWSSPLRSYRPLLVATHASTTTRTCAGIRATTTAGGIPASSTRGSLVRAPRCVRCRRRAGCATPLEVSVPGTT